MDVTTLIGQLPGTVVGAVITLFGVRWNEKSRARESDASFERQWRQDQKLKLYSQLLRAVNDYSIWLADLSENWKFGTGSKNTIKRGCADIAEDFHAAYAVAPLFLAKDSLALLEVARPAFFYHSSPFPDGNVQDADKNWELLKDTRTKLAELAKQDFTIESVLKNVV